MASVTLFMNEVHRTNSSSEILPLVYEELRRLAGARLRQLGPGQTIQATALVHEAYLKLVGASSDGNGWVNQAHFFAAASEAMRRLLIDRYRRKKSSKRGGQHINRVDLDLECVVIPDSQLDLIAISEAIDMLESIDPNVALLVKLKFFAGMTMQEIADVLEVSMPTAERSWRYARAFLAHHLRDMAP